MTADQMKLYAAQLIDDSEGHEGYADDHSGYVVRESTRLRADRLVARVTARATGNESRCDLYLMVLHAFRGTCHSNRRKPARRTRRAKRTPVIVVVDSDAGRRAYVTEQNVLATELIARAREACAANDVLTAERLAARAGAIVARTSALVTGGTLPSESLN